MEFFLTLSQLQEEQRPTSPQNTTGQPEEIIMGQVTWPVEVFIALFTSSQFLLKQGELRQQG